MPAISPFQLEISDFKFVDPSIRSGRGGRALRCTVTWKFTHSEYGLLGISMDGWLVSKHSRGYRVAPPLSKFGPHQSKQLCVVTTDLHDTILRMLRETKTSAGNNYLSYLEAPGWTQPLDPSEVDIELPRTISSGEEEETKDNEVHGTTT